MLLTKTETRILELFVSEPAHSFTIREVSRTIKKDLKIVHTSIKNLEKNNFFLKDKHNRLQLNYRNNLSDLAYAENLRTEKFLKKYPSLKIPFADFLRKTKLSFFVLLVFGSYAEGKPRKDSDVDILGILPAEDKNNSFERQLNSVVSLSCLKSHITVISRENFNEMINKREELNVVNEVLNRHIIIFGAELYYKLLGERHVR